MADADSPNSLTREELLKLVIQQQRLIEKLRAEIEQLKRRRSAAPFSKGSPKVNPNRPGRRRGQGVFRRRSAPAAGSDHPITQVKVTASQCPECGGDLGEVEEEVASTTDIPEQPQAEVKVYAVEVRRCRRCGKPVRGHDPGVAPGQQGATAHRMGARVKALAHVLHYGHGVPVRKLPAIIREFSGIQITQSALTQDALKQSGGAVGAAYQRMREKVGKSEVVHTDDTGWRVGGKGAFLMVFTNAEQSVYQIRDRHRNEEVRELIPGDFGGVLVSDRGKSYEAEELSGIRQQKCLAHLIRNAADVSAGKKGQANQFSQRLKDLLQGAVALGKDYGQTPRDEYERRVEKVEVQITHHLRNRILRDDDNQRLLNGVGTQHDRGHLLRFLRDPRIEATNNRAERALRPAVIARKVSHCSKNSRGARALEAFVSVVETAKKTPGASVTASLSAIIRGGSPPSPP